MAAFLQLLLLGVLVCALFPGHTRSTAAPGQSTDQGSHVSSTPDSSSERNARSRNSLHPRAPQMVMEPITVFCANGYADRDDSPDSARFVSCRSMDNVDHWCSKQACNEVELTNCHSYWGSFGDKNRVAWYMPTAEVTASRYWVDNKNGRMAVIPSHVRPTGTPLTKDQGQNGWMCNWDPKDQSAHNRVTRNSCNSCKRA